ncbi:hypothetical protein B0A52_05576 [Exophiala mesophila]|uniref:Uncharacterized protein n=1 Tax=Exophiala mesophila TaxID=212818 RepID=A0A438N3A8_EXOME|nr:hypothetical protein B0A52_05576 [Exophiala mesophila]
MAQNSGDCAVPPPTTNATAMSPRAIASVIYWMKTTLSHIREQELLRSVPDDDVITLTPDEVAAMFRQPRTTSAWQYNPLEEEMLDECTNGRHFVSGVSTDAGPESQEQSRLAEGDDNNDVLCEYDIHEGEVTMCDDSGIDVCNDGSEDCHTNSNNDNDNDDLLDDLFESIIDIDKVDCGHGGDHDNNSTNSTNNNNNGDH